MQSTGHTSTQALSLTLMHGSTITYAMEFSPLRLALPSGADDSVPHACPIQLLVISSSFHSSRPLPSGTIPSTGRLSTTPASRGVRAFATTSAPESGLPPSVLDCRRGAPRERQEGEPDKVSGPTVGTHAP